MFPNNGAVAAVETFRRYFLAHDLTTFPEATRPWFTGMTNEIPYTTLTLGLERLYAALNQFPADMPDFPGAVAVLGEASQAAADSYMQNKAERWMALNMWAAETVNGVTPSVIPPVDEQFSLAVAPSVPPV